MAPDLETIVFAPGYETGAFLTGKDLPFHYCAVTDIRMLPGDLISIVLHKDSRREFMEAERARKRAIKAFGVVASILTIVAVAAFCWGIG